jgi:hypothetical protein
MWLLNRPRHGQENVHVYTVFISLRIGKRRELFEHSNHFKTPVPVAARSTVARLLRLLVRIPPAAWMSVVSAVCCEAEVSATS